MLVRGYSRPLFCHLKEIARKRVRRSHALVTIRAPSPFWNPGTSLSAEKKHLFRSQGRPTFRGSPEQRRRSGNGMVLLSLLVPMTLDPKARTLDFLLALSSRRKTQFSSGTSKQSV